MSTAEKLFAQRARKWLASTGLPKGRVRQMTDERIAGTVARVYPGGIGAFMVKVVAA